MIIIWLLVMITIIKLKNIQLWFCSSDHEEYVFFFRNRMLYLIIKLRNSLRRWVLYNYSPKYINVEYLSILEKCLDSITLHIVRIRREKRSMLFQSIFAWTIIQTSYIVRREGWTTDHINLHNAGIFSQK